MKTVEVNIYFPKTKRSFIYLKGTISIGLTGKNKKNNKKSTDAPNSLPITKDQTPNPKKASTTVTIKVKVELIKLNMDVFLKSILFLKRPIAGRPNALITKLKDISLITSKDAGLLKKPAKKGETKNIRPTITEEISTDE
jgi:hypothetical protein